MYVNPTGNLSDFDVDELIEGVTDYGEDILKNVTDTAKDAIIDKAGELLGTKKETVPTTQTATGTQPQTTVVNPPTTPATVPLQPAVMPKPEANDSPVNVVVSKVKQFPGWGIGAVAGTITYLISKSIIGGVAVAGGSWFLFDKAVKK